MIGQLRLALDGSPWVRANRADLDANAIYRRHYSARSCNSRQLVGPGSCIVLVTPDLRALFVWRKFIDHAIPKQRGVNCAVFRNEGAGLSSDLILAAEPFARRRWPRAKRFYTYIDAERTAARRGRRNPPGYCFIRAGYTPCGRTRGGLLIIKKLIRRIGTGLTRGTEEFASRR